MRREVATPRELETFFARPAATVAPQLLGSTVGCNGVTVRLTEVEAYAGVDDPASHASRGPTPRAAVMFGPPGRVYVYFVYGAHWAVNLVCHPDGVAGAVLLRAGEIIAGEASARLRRGERPARVQLARGPGNLASALGVTGAMTGSTLWDGPLVWAPASRPGEHQVGPRVGVTGGADAPMRMWLPGEPSVSTYKRSKRARPTT
ncbi:MAG: DNA-3-methyladenine glycosylase [Nocardioidaceae bacterium]|nr:DNA-3-methyladenine glycosylase [Nocardioidaceae bacterium]